VGARGAVALVSLLAVAQILTLTFYYFFVMEPQARRLATLMAQNVTAIAETMNRLPAADQSAFLARLSKSPYLRVYEGVGDWPEETTRPTLLESFFLTMLAERLSKDANFEWRRGSEGRIWIAMNLAGKRYWMSTRAPDEWRPEWAFALTATVSLSLSIAAGLILQRRFGRSLRALAGAAQRVSLGSSPERVPANGPREIRELGESFDRMTERLAAAERERNLMLAGISHDLRTPLSKIRLATEMLPASDDDLKATIVRQIETMDAMFAQFLDFARGLDQEPLADVLPGAIVADALEALGRTDIKAVATSATPIRAKPVALHRAVSNLIANALKYGRPPFTVETTYTDKACTIAVRDHGPGLSAVDRARLIEPFARGDDARGGTQGSGLGLAIAARVAKAHGGTLDLADAEGGGLKASLVLPVAQP
jgi:two-component system osmolarity sensor histidine kinase EnvZ